MAPTFAHGKGSRVLCNKTDMSVILRDGTVKSSVSIAKVTAYQQNDEAYIPGVEDGIATWEGFFDGSTANRVHDAIQTTLGGTTANVWTYGPQGDTLGNRARLLRDFQTDFDIHTPSKDAVAVTVAGQQSGPVGYGVWQKALAATASTGASVGVDNAVTSAIGGVAHLHVTASSGGVTAFITKVQHSSNNATWADLITFATSTTTSVQRSTVAGTIKRYTREIRTSFTGGGSKSVTSAVAFARF